MAGMILSLITFLPAVAALILLVFLRDDDEAAANNARWVALIATVITFVASVLMLGDFDPQNTGFQLVHEAEWVMGLTYKLGVDGISILFVMLTTFMMPLVIYASWGVTTRVKEYMVAFLLLETLMLGVFMAYAIGISADADCDDRNVCRRRHSRHSNIDDTSVRF
jgi:NADH-quinone oxidoreductase subunit M